MSVRRNSPGVATAEVPDAAPAVLGRVTVRDFAPETVVRDADPIAVARHRREIEDCRDDVRCRPTAPENGDDAALGVRAVDPGEAAGLEVELMEGAFADVEGVQIPDPPLHPRVRRLREQFPIELPVVTPLAPLPDLAAHEEELLPG